MHRVLRVELSTKKVQQDIINELTIREYIGGLGIGARILYDEVLPGINWNDPENRFIISTGPLNGTLVAGTGSFCIITKGCLTNGATSSQANGFFGAFIRLSGFDTLVINGQSSEWVYLYIHDSILEFRDASQLIGKDTIETENLVKKELGGKAKDLSVYSIGPSGENMVRFASVVGDMGHVVGHNGVGAVMASKKIKAFVTARGKCDIEIKNKMALSDLNKKMLARTKLETQAIYEQGTSFLLGAYMGIGTVPIKNLTTNVFPNYQKLTGEYYRSRFELKPRPCWRCPLKHCHTIKVTEGAYEGYVGDEPEYELFAGWGPLIGQSDPGAVVMLSDTVDRLGFDSNEASWLIALVIECYENGILTKSDTDGLEMTWGNVESVKKMLHKIAYREGIGNVLAEGVMRAAEQIGGEAPSMGVYVKKGIAPRNHDHRARWLEMIDTATSDCGTMAVGPQPVDDPRSPKSVIETLTQKRIRNFVDSLVICAFPSMTMTNNKIDYLVEILNCITGWDYDENEVSLFNGKIDNILRAFNIRSGIKPESEFPSKRYGSEQLDGPVKAESIMPYWNNMISEYYKIMEWDRITGKPYPETLKKYGLDDIIKDIW